MFDYAPTSGSIEQTDRYFSASAENKRVGVAGVPSQLAVSRNGG